MKIRAQEIHFSTDEGIAVVGFQDDDSRYVLLTRALDPGDQARNPDLQGIHLEVEDQSRSGYDLIATAKASPQGLELLLNPEGINHIGEAEITVDFEMPQEAADRFRETINRLFEGHAGFTYQP